MKLSLTAVTLAAMAGSASAAVLEFDPAIKFKQYDTGCGGNLIVTGEIVAIKHLEYGSFCITDNIEEEDGSISKTYSKVEITECASDRIYENWSKCIDQSCSFCDGGYSSYTTWESIKPESGTDHCYVYNFSFEAGKTTRKASFEDALPIYFNFDADSDQQSIADYLMLMDENSCIADGPPAADEPSLEEPATPMDTGTEETPMSDMGDMDMTKEDPVSGASALAASAAFGVAAITAMFL